MAITDAVLSSSTVVEVAPAAYAAGATYAAGAQAAVGAVGTLLAVYESLQAGNIGKDPALNPAWWKKVGEAYTAYNAGANYGLDAIVIDPATHTRYESQVAGNTGQPLSDKTKWLPLGPTNRHAMFHYLRNGKTVSESDIVVVLRPVSRVNSVALKRIEGATVKVVMKVGGNQVYAVTKQMIRRRSHGLYDFMYGPFRQVRNLLLTDLPPYRNAEITITISRPGAGRRACGACVIGTSIYLGDVEYDPESDQLNFSIIDRNEWGDATLYPKRTIPKAKMVIEFSRTRTDTVLAAREALNAVPAIYAGITDYADGYFEPLFLLGVWKQFSINLREATRGFINLEVEDI
jgi:hypothetical protein